MKKMKGLGGLDRMLGSVRRKNNDQQPPTTASLTSGQAQSGVPNAPLRQDSAEVVLGTPEANASRSVKLFCESGGPGHNQGDEVLHLPTIVEAAEASAPAAQECARQIRKFLAKDLLVKPYLQYNAIMLMRILADNPGYTFTKNMDKKFVDAVKEVIRFGQDPSVQALLRETLETWTAARSEDPTLALMLGMWKKEQVKIAKVLSDRASITRPDLGRSSSSYQGVPQQVPPPPRNQLPNPTELASRVEEARTSAKLLTQFVQSTPPTEFLENDLIKEFVERCSIASRKIQGYMQAENPAPDNDTMLTLIETNEQIYLAISKHQRGVLQARKVLGLNTPDAGPTPATSPPAASDQSYAPPPGPPPPQIRKPLPQSPPIAAAGASAAPVSSTPAVSKSTEAPSNEDPFADSNAMDSHDSNGPPIDQQEPFHPGFRPTQSYVGRQESSLGNITMTAGIPATPQQESAPVATRVTDDDGDLYDDSPQRKKPVYRY